MAANVINLRRLTLPLLSSLWSHERTGERTATGLLSEMEQRYATLITINTTTQTVSGLISIQSEIKESTETSYSA